MGQNCLIYVVSVRKIYSFSFIFSEGVIKCAGDSCIGNISCYNLLHLPGAGFGKALIVSPLAVIHLSGIRMGARGPLLGHHWN